MNDDKEMCNACGEYQAVTTVTMDILYDEHFEGLLFKAKARYCAGCAEDTLLYGGSFDEVEATQC